MRTVGACDHCGGLVVFETAHAGGQRRCLGCDARGVEVIVSTDGDHYEAPEDVPTLVEDPSDEPTVVTSDPTAPWRAAQEGARP